VANPLPDLPGVSDELIRVESHLERALRSNDDFLTEVASHLASAGGKRGRPAFAIAAATCGAGASLPVADEVIDGGVAVELVHLGSLYHDDVMDEAEIRRSVESVNHRWGNLTAILAGDFLLARASEIAASLGTEVAALLAATIARLCEGQVLELQHAFDTGRTIDRYFISISGKTAELFATASRIGAIVGGLPREQVEHLTVFGHGFGMVFQIVDDLLDITATSAELGKPAGHDMEEGVYTLPVLHALAGPDGAELDDLLGKEITPAVLDKALSLVRGSDGIAAATSEARRRAQDCVAELDSLPDSPAKSAMVSATSALVTRFED